MIIRYLSDAVYIGFDAQQKVFRVFSHFFHDLLCQIRYSYTINRSITHRTRKELLNNGRV